MELNQLSIAYMVPVLITGILGILTWIQGLGRQVRLFLFLNFAVFLWAVTETLIVSSTTLAGISFWLKIQYLAIPMVPVLWLLVIMRYTGRENQVTLRNAALLSIFPLITFLLVCTNSYHHLYYSSVGIDTSGLYPLQSLARGPWFWLHIAYSYSLIVLSLGLLLYRLVYKQTIYRGQTMTLLIACLIVMASNISYIARLFPFANVDPSPFAFAIAGIIMVVSIFKYRTLDLVPIARDHVFENMSDAVVVIDRNGRLIDCNQHAVDIFHWVEPVIGTSITQLWGNQPGLLQYPISAENMSNTELLFDDNGVTRYYQVSTAHITDEQQENTAQILMLHDITQRKQAEVARLEFERKVQISNRLATVGEMAAGIAHEINNPLTPILGFSETLMHQDLPEDILEDIRIIHSCARRTADVTMRMLTFARQTRPVRTVCNINELIESTAQLRAYRLQTDGIQVITELSPALPLTLADPGQLQQMFLNLVINAEYEMKTNHEGGILRIKTEQAGNNISILFIDNGPGISKANMEKLFTPFFTTKKMGEGAGFGLSVCHGIVTDHNGSIYAVSEEGQGATFIVELPIVAGEKEEEPKRFEASADKSKGDLKARILVVDDEPVIVQILKRVLTDEGYEVDSTGKAEEALKLIRSGEYACILLDIKIPDMSGIDLYRHLAETDKSLAQRIIFVTGDIMGADTGDFFFRTGAAYVTKPFNINEIIKEVERKLTLITGNKTGNKGE